MAFDISVLLNITTKYESVVVIIEDVDTISLFNTEVQLLGQLYISSYYLFNSCGNTLPCIFKGIVQSFYPR